MKTSGSPIARFKSYFPLFVPVFLSALRKVDQLSIALESRGFGAGIKRTSFIEFKFAKKDWVFLIFCLLLATGCIALRLFGFGFVKF